MVIFHSFFVCLPEGKSKLSCQETRQSRLRRRVVGWLDFRAVDGRFSDVIMEKFMGT